MAEAYHIQIAPHCYCGPIVGAANIQLAVTLPNFLILESLKQWDGFHAKLLKKKIEWQDGKVIPSKEPGIGVELDEAVCDAHPYDGPQLHLQMAQDAAVSLRAVSASPAHRDRAGNHLECRRDAAGRLAVEIEKGSVGARSPNGSTTIFLPFRNVQDGNALWPPE